MRFTMMNDAMQMALMEFCAEQELMSDYMDENELGSLVEAAFAVLNRIPAADMKEFRVYRYHFYAGKDYTHEIFPEHIRENGLLCERAIHLATIPLDNYAAGDSRLIYRGYDVVYDVNKEHIMLLYHIIMADKDVTTIYRTETETYEDFDSYEFIIELAAQMAAKLKRNLCVSEMCAPFRGKEAA